jgi:uncharacterized protein YbaP (TraB family)
MLRDRAVWIFVTLFACFGCHAASVFKVTKGDNHLYIGGTLHLLSEDDYPLPKQYQSAYENSELIVFETDLTALTSVEFSKSMLNALTYKEGKTLEDTLSPDTLDALSRYLKSRGLTLSQFMNYKPSLMSMTLSMLELKHMGLTSEGVDKYFHSQAHADKKPVAWLETPEQQISFIAHMGNDNPDAFMRYSLNDLSTLPAVLPTLKESWKSGNLNAMYNESLANFKATYPEVFSTIITHRNTAWLNDIETYLATPDTEFVLVGALHLPGEVGLIHQLTERGYSVSQVN